MTAKGGFLVSTPFIPDNNALINIFSKQYNNFRKNNARLASATSMNEISENKKNKKINSQF